MPVSPSLLTPIHPTYSALHQELSTEMKKESNIILWYKNSCRKRGSVNHVSLLEGKLRLPAVWATWGQEGCRHLGTESGGRSTLWLVFRNGKGVAQQEHLSQSSTRGPPSPEAGMEWLQTSTAGPGAPRPRTTIPDSPKKRSVGDRNRSVRSGPISNPVPPTHHS